MKRLIMPVFALVCYILYRIISSDIIDFNCVNLFQICDIKNHWSWKTEICMVNVNFLAMFLRKFKVSKGTREVL